MNPNLKFIFVFLLSMSFQFGSAAQPLKTPRWIPEQGNWMVETNIHTPLHSIVYFYLNDGTIIYKETIDGMKLDVRKRKIKIRLKKVLDHALIAWHEKKELVVEKEWVAAMFNTR